MTTSQPQQFRFDGSWLRVIYPLRKKPRISAALDGLKREYREMSEWAYEELDHFDKEQAYRELILSYHIAEVRCMDFHWLLGAFDNIHLAYLAEAIAQELYPDDSWLVLENGEEAVVTNVGRTIVFDMKNGHRMSAGVSLLFVNDSKYVPTEDILKEFVHIKDSDIELEREAIRGMRRDLDSTEIAKYNFKDKPLILNKWF